MTRMSTLSAMITVLLLLSAASTLIADTPALTDPPRHDFPRVGEYEVLCGDFHMHTVNSDGEQTTREKVLEAYNYGYDAIAITDHGTARSYRLAASLARPLGLIVLRGAEMDIRDRPHLVVLNVSADYQPRNPRWAAGPGEENAFYQDQMREIRLAGGLIVYAHPHAGFTDAVQWGIAEGIVRGVEVKNAEVGSGYDTVESHGTYCYPFAFDWALDHDLALFANSDSHNARSGDQPVTLVLVKERSPSGVTEAIRELRTVAWFKGMLWGREELLSKLIESTVKVRRTPEGILVENCGPVALTAALTGVAGNLIEIEPYGEKLIGAEAGGDTISVTWQNVWISPRENLRSAFDVTTR
ncbi:MAG: hypothetical protein A2Z18_00680 [Armatimonadetes bacterium RBG_16_58_9]|nr:MAG: hypothetical protein A2Z18_00680 [Armatimonadetes bacterium RBG_16_58_9]